MKIIRVLKWGIREHLDEGKDLLQAIIESEEYVEYTLDRRLGCRQLASHAPVLPVTPEARRPAGFFTPGARRWRPSPRRRAAG